MDRLPSPEEFLLAVPDDPGYEQIQNPSKPRASGLYNCARQQAYYLAGTPETNSPQPDLRYTQAQGRVLEDLSFEAMNKLGLPVGSVQLDMPDSHWVTGHIDGMLEDGTGIEHKVPNVYQYTRIVRNGITEAKKDWLVQATCYGAGLGWDKVLFIVVAQDAAATKAEKTRFKKKYGDEDWNPKVYLELIDLVPFYLTLAPSLERRARQLATLKGQPENVKREFDSTAKFPCGYCAYQSQCQLDGEGSLEVEPCFT